MKKLLTTVITLAISIATFAQITFGVKAGLNISQLSGTAQGCIGSIQKNTQSSIAKGFNLGGYANYSFNNTLGLQIEAMFSVQGGKYSTNDNEKQYIFLLDEMGIGKLNVNGTQRLSYINIPLLIDFKPFNAPVSFFAGPQFGYCINRTFVEGIVETDKTFASAYNDFDFAIALGAQYTFVEHLTMGIRAN